MSNSPMCSTTTTLYVIPVATFCVLTSSLITFLRLHFTISKYRNFDTSQVPPLIDQPETQRLTLQTLSEKHALYLQLIEHAIREKKNQLIPTFSLEEPTCLHRKPLERLQREAIIESQYALLWHQQETVTEVSRQVFKRCDVDGWIDNLLEDQSVKDRCMEAANVVMTSPYSIHSSDTNTSESAGIEIHNHPTQPLLYKFNLFPTLNDMDRAFKNAQSAITKNGTSYVFRLFYDSFISALPELNILPSEDEILTLRWMDDAGDTHTFDVSIQALFREPLETARNAPDAFYNPMPDPHSSRSSVRVLVEDVPGMGLMGQVYVPFFDRVIRRLIQTYPHLYTKFSRNNECCFVPCLHRNSHIYTGATHQSKKKPIVYPETDGVRRSKKPKRDKMTFDELIMHHQSVFEQYMSDYQPRCSIMVTLKPLPGYTSDVPLIFHVLVVNTDMTTDLQNKFDLQHKPFTRDIMSFINRFLFLKPMVVRHHQGRVESTKTAFLHDHPLNSKLTFHPSIFREVGAGPSEPLSLLIKSVDMNGIPANMLKDFRTAFQVISPENPSSALFEFLSANVKKLPTNEPVQQTQRQLSPTLEQVKKQLADTQKELAALKSFHR